MGVPRSPSAGGNMADAWEPVAADEMRARRMLLMATDLDGRILPPDLRSATQLLARDAAAANVPDHSASPPPATNVRRFLKPLKGGDVPRCRLTDPADAARARALIADGLPVVLVGGGAVACGSALAGWTASSVLRELRGREAAALVAPTAAARRFAFYTAAAHTGGYDPDAFFRPVDGPNGPALSAGALAVDVDEALEDARHGGASSAADPAAPTVAEATYLQLRVFHADDGGFDACAPPRRRTLRCRPCSLARPAVGVPCYLSLSNRTPTHAGASCRPRCAPKSSVASTGTR